MHHYAYPAYSQDEQHRAVIASDVSFSVRSLAPTAEAAAAAAAAAVW